MINCKLCIGFYYQLTFTGSRADIKCILKPDVATPNIVAWYTVELGPYRNNIHYKCSYFIVIFMFCKDKTAEVVQLYPYEKIIVQRYEQLM